jgi:hypothetical protein
MYRTRIYADNPSQQIVLGFDDCLCTFFVTVLDLHTSDVILDRGTSWHELMTLEDFLLIVQPFCQQLPLPVLHSLISATQ